MLADELKWVKFSGASWTNDGKGFFYSRFPEPKKDDDVPEPEPQPEALLPPLGTPQSDDVLVYERPDQPEVELGGGVTEDGRYLIITVGDGTDQPQVPHRVQGPERAVRQARRPDRQPRQQVQLPRQRRRRCSTSRPTSTPRSSRSSPSTSASPDAKNWKTIIPEAKDTLAERRPRRQPASSAAT